MLIERLTIQRLCQHVRVLILSFSYVTVTFPASMASRNYIMLEVNVSSPLTTTRVISLFNAASVIFLDFNTILRYTRVDELLNLS